MIIILEEIFILLRFTYQIKREHSNPTILGLDMFLLNYTYILDEMQK